MCLFETRFHMQEIAYNCAFDLTVKNWPPSQKPQRIAPLFPFCFRFSLAKTTPKQPKLEIAWQPFQAKIHDSFRIFDHELFQLLQKGAFVHERGIDKDSAKSA